MSEKRKPKIKVFNPSTNREEEFNANPKDNSLVDDFDEYRRLGQGFDSAAASQMLYNKRKKAGYIKD